MSQAFRTAIVGGGIAGLAAANALAFAGIEADLFEQSASFGEIGAGINLSPQAVKVLFAVGLKEKALSLSNASKGTFNRDMLTGEELGYNDTRNAQSKYGAPFLTFRRSDLIDVLSSGINTARVHLNHRLAGIEATASGSVVLTFASGETRTVDVVIAADGARSLIRRSLYGDDQPQYTGQMVWRAMLKGSDVPPEVLEPSGHIRWVGPRRHAHGYYLRGRDLVNITTQEDTQNWVEESWSLRGDAQEMRATFSDSEPRLKKLMSLVTECSKWGLFLRAPTDNWGRGAIQIIGDAAHAMLPNAGQGACQAIEDGYILARWLAAESDPYAALASFRRVRIPRVQGIQRRSELNARIFHMGDRKSRDAMLGQTAENSKDGSGMEWIVGYDPIGGWNKVPMVPVIRM